MSNLINLEYLEVSYNQITNVSPLKDLVNLEDLRLTGNPISDYSPISFVRYVRVD